MTRSNNRVQRNRETLVLPIFLFILLSPYLLFSQYYNAGVDNSKIRWKEIDTENYQLIFPDYYEEKAREYARLIDFYSPYITRSLKTELPKIPIIIHPNTSFSNGVVVWAPKRVELWTNKDISPRYAFDWDAHLICHELRHVAQINSLYVGFNGFLARFFGQHIIGGILGLYIPMSFLEGDAVLAETALNPSGRGDSPEYDYYLKALVLDKGRQPYSKAKLGSFRSFVPNHYILGYQMVAFSRYKHGRDIWGEFLERSSKNFWSIRRLTNSDTVSFTQKSIYNDALDFLSLDWNLQDSLYQERNKDVNPIEIGSKQKAYTNYYSPVIGRDNKIYTIKTNLGSPSELIYIENVDNKIEEKRLSFASAIIENHIDYGFDKLVWSEYRPHRRWENESYSDVIEYDISSSKTQRLTYGRRIYKPVYNPKNPDLILGIESDSLNNHSIIILNKALNSVETIKTMEDNYSITSVVWSEDGRTIYYIDNGRKGCSIRSFNLDSKEEEVVLPYLYIHKTIKNLRVLDDRVYFLGSFDNLYNLYSISKDGDTRIHSDSRFSINNYFLGNDSILISDYTSDGYRLFNIANQSKPIELNEIKTFFLAEYSRNQEGVPSLSLKDNEVESKPYKKHRNLFNFHSWAPLYINAYSQEIGFGLSAFSQNLLSSSVLEAGYRFKTYNKSNNFSINYTYSGLYPILSVGVRQSDRYLGYDFNQLVFSSLISLPYRSNNNNWNRYFENSFEYSYTSISPKAEVNNYKPNDFSSFGIESKGQVIRPMGRKDIRPRLGISYLFNTRFSLSEEIAYIFEGSTSVFLPGPFPNHSLEIGLSAQSNTPELYYYENHIGLTRGYYGIFPKSFYGLRTNYTMPIAYPDLSLLGLFYYQRLRLNTFYDIGYYDNRKLSSIGVDLFLDFNIFRLETLISIGYRQGYSLEYGFGFGNLFFYLNL